MRHLKILYLSFNTLEVNELFLRLNVEWFISSLRSYFGKFSSLFTILFVKFVLVSLRHSHGTTFRCLIDILIVFV